MVDVHRWTGNLTELSKIPSERFSDECQSRATSEEVESLSPTDLYYLGRRQLKTPIQHVIVRSDHDEKHLHRFVFYSAEAAISVFFFASIALAFSNGESLNSLTFLCWRRYLRKSSAGFSGMLHLPSV